MIKYLYFIFILSVTIGYTASAQEKTPYEIQRAKVNSLLAQRSAKFGQYDHSLNERTGIFGFQTKRDIKNSNEILRQIALNDNEIFTQLKVLMDYKDLQAEEIKYTANLNAENIINYRKTIKDLQVENAKLNEELKKAEAGSGSTNILFVLLLLITAALGFFLFQKYKKLKLHKTTSI